MKKNHQLNKKDLESILSCIYKNYDINAEEMLKFLKTYLVVNYLVSDNGSIFINLRNPVHGQKQFFYYKKGDVSKFEAEYYSRNP